MSDAKKTFIKEFSKTVEIPLNDGSGLVYVPAHTRINPNGGPDVEVSEFWYYKNKDGSITKYNKKPTVWEKAESESLTHKPFANLKSDLQDNGVNPDNFEKLDGRRNNRPPENIGEAHIQADRLESFNQTNKEKLSAMIFDACQDMVNPVKQCPKCKSTDMFEYRPTYTHYNSVISHYLVCREKGCGGKAVRQELTLSQLKKMRDNNSFSTYFKGDQLEVLKNWESMPKAPVVSKVEERNANQFKQIEALANSGASLKSVMDAVEIGSATIQRICIKASRADVWDLILANTKQERLNNKAAKVAQETLQVQEANAKEIVKQLVIEKEKPQLDEDGIRMGTVWDNYKADLKAGLTIMEIAKKYNKTYSAITNAARHVGDLASKYQFADKRNGGRRSSVDDKQFLEDLSMLSAQEAAIKQGVSVAAVYARLKTLGFSVKQLKNKSQEEQRKVLGLDTIKKMEEKQKEVINAFATPTAEVEKQVKLQEKYPEADLQISEAQLTMMSMTSNDPKVLVQVFKKGDATAHFTLLGRIREKLIKEEALTNEVIEAMANSPVDKVSYIGRVIMAARKAKED